MHSVIWPRLLRTVALAFAALILACGFGLGLGVAAARRRGGAADRACSALVLLGSSTPRLVLSLLLRKRTVSTEAALKLLDDANTAIQYNREILQTALDHVRQGISVFDKDLQLICWNRQFGEILDLPPEERVVAFRERVERWARPGTPRIMAIGPTS